MTVPPQARASWGDQFLPNYLWLLGVLPIPSKARGYTDEIEYLKYPKNKWRNIESLSSDDNLNVSPLEYFLLPGGSGGVFTK